MKTNMDSSSKKQHVDTVCGLYLLVSLNGFGGSNLTDLDGEVANVTKPHFYLNHQALSKG